MKPLIHVSQLKKKIHKFGLGPINLQIEPGTVTTLIGNNGSGKSTLLKMIMDLVKPDDGIINVFNQSVSGESESWKKSIAYQPQTPIGYDGFTGKSLKDLITFSYPNFDEGLFTKMIRLFNIPLAERFDRMSQGVQQKLVLALTIARNTKVLILDEPTSFIDIPSKKILMDLLVDWMDNGERAILLASHQAEDIEKFSDYLYVLHDGKEVGHFEKEQLTGQYRRYLISGDLPEIMIDGEVFREKFGIVSNEPDKTEQFLHERGISWSSRTAIELEEIITILLTKENRRG